MSAYGEFKMTFEEARDKIDEYDNLSDSDFEAQVRRWVNFEVPFENYGSEIHRALRDSLVSVFGKALSEGGLRGIDLEIGLRLYEILNPDDGSFDLIDANDDDVWRFISVKVMPDLTFIRYPNRPEDYEILEDLIPGIAYSRTRRPENGSKKIRKKRFYAHTRRIWLKTLWWYVYLSWQGDAASTREILKNNGSNVISQLIERPGNKGYRIELFRSIMRTYSTLDGKTDLKFRAAAKLNLAKCHMIEPGLTAGGVDGYSKNLFEEVEFSTASEEEPNAEEDNT